eukprot:scaffold3118_cov64-Cylindrotheca_fusiformis.AAC.14
MFSCEYLFYKFCGCILRWLEGGLDDTMEESLVAKAKDAVKKNGDDLLERASDSRGSIVHIHVEF